MIRRHETGLRFALMAVDAVLVVAVFVVVLALRFGPDWPRTVDQLVPSPQLFMALYAAAWIGLLRANGLYRPRARWSIRSEALGVAEAAAFLAFGTLAVLFLLGQSNVSRITLVVVFPLQVLVTVLARAALRWVLREARARGRSFRSVIVIGTSQAAQRFAERLRDRWDLGLKVVGFVGPKPRGSISPSPYLGTIDRLPSLLHEQVIDEVAICLPLTQRARIEDVYRLCAAEGKTIRIPIELPGEILSAGRVEDLDGTPVLSRISGPEQSPALMAKRSLDILGATLGLIFLSPLFVPVAIAILISDGRPVLFRQPRAGVHGRPFSIVKFRTMTRNADAQRAELRGSNEVTGSAAFKMTNDPRITAVGRFLRKTSIDELPQLWNVLRGEMSLVGPRPHPFDDVAGYDPWHRRRLSMKPGITGLWQIAGRREPSFDRWVELDLEYIDHWSLLLDLRLLIQTIPAMLRAEGR
jgi:exopolysaccharide biosynthesis polyprenyl glycosylphosphotransferase